MQIVQAVSWSPDGQAVRIIDQRRLPEAYVERDLRTVPDVCDAIRTLAVRGAPAIGIAGAMGLAVTLQPFISAPADLFRRKLLAHAEEIRSARPTAVNLGWAIDRLLAAVLPDAEAHEVLAALRREAEVIFDEDRAMCERIGEHGAQLIDAGTRVLTHCNAGALATGGIGTALAPIYVAARRGRTARVYASETRPLMQGSRLTAWELSRAGIPVTVLADGAAASLLASRRVDLVIVGADRIAANGDVANKIGTLAIAVAARQYDVPFYVAAPTSTLDPETPTGADIPIEHRAPDELLAAFGTQLAPENIAAYNPAFDVTPADLVTGYLTDRRLFSDAASLFASLLEPSVRTA